MCIVCVEHQIRKWRKKVKETGEPLTKEETEKLLLLASYAVDQIEHQDDIEQTLVDLGVEKSEGCLEGKEILIPI